MNQFGKKFNIYKHNIGWTKEFYMFQIWMIKQVYSKELIMK